MLISEGLCIRLWKGLIIYHFVFKTDVAATKLSLSISKNFLWKHRDGLEIPRSPLYSFLFRPQINLWKINTAPASGLWSISQYSTFISLGIRSMKVYMEIWFLISDCWRISNGIFFKAERKFCHLFYCKKGVVNNNREQAMKGKWRILSYYSVP